MSHAHILSDMPITACGVKDRWHRRRKAYGKYTLDTLWLEQQKSRTTVMNLEVNQSEGPDQSLALDTGQLRPSNPYSYIKYEYVHIRNTKKGEQRNGIQRVETTTSCGT